jgi:hypothetical protein
MRPRPGTVVAGMAELIMPSVTPCVAAMCSPISSAPAAMPAVGQTRHAGEQNAPYTTVASSCIKSPCQGTQLQMVSAMQSSCDTSRKASHTLINSADLKGMRVDYRSKCRLIQRLTVCSNLLTQLEDTLC